MTTAKRDTRNVRLYRDEIAGTPYGYAVCAKRDHANEWQVIDWHDGYNAPVKVAYRSKAAAIARLAELANAPEGCEPEMYSGYRVRKINLYEGFGIID